MTVNVNVLKLAWIGVMALLALDRSPAATTALAQPGDTKRATKAGDADDEELQPAPDEPSIPGLEEMLKTALENNPDIRAAKAQLAVYQAELDRTRLQVVKQLTAFREKWQGQKVALRTAEIELTELQKSADKGIVAQRQVHGAREKVALARAKLREIEAELPFLLGRPAADAGLERAANGPPSSGRKLLKEKLRPLVEQGVKLSLESFRAGQADVEEAIAWLQRLLEVELDLADDTASRIAALEEHRSRYGGVVDWVEAMYQAGNARQQDVLAARYHLLQVELMLLKENADE